MASNIKVLALTLFLLLLGAAVFAQSPASDGKDGLFFVPFRVNFDAKNNLAYVLDRSGTLTILDGNDYQLVKKFEIVAPANFYSRTFANFQIDEKAGKIYLVADAPLNALFILDLPDKNTLLSLSLSEILEKGVKISLSGENQTKGPFSLFLNQKKQKLYLIAGTSRSELIVIDLKKNEITRRAGLGFSFYLAEARKIYNSKNDKIYILEKEMGNLYALTPQPSSKEAGGAKIKVENLTKDQKVIDFTLDKNENRIYFISENSLFRLDLSNKAISPGLSLDKLPSRIFYSGNLKRIFVTSWMTDDITVVNPATMKIEKTIPLAKGSEPGYLFLNGFTNKIFVQNIGLNSITVIDAQTLLPEKTIATPHHPSNSFVVNPINHDVITSFTEPYINSLLVISPNFETKLIGQPVSEKFFDVIQKIVVNEDKGDIYVLNNAGKRSKLTDINPKKREVAWTIEVGQNCGDMLFNKNKNILYVMASDEDAIISVNAQNGKIIKSIAVGDKPIAIAANSDFSRVYTADSISDTVSVIDTAANNIIETIKVGNGPAGLFYDDKNKNLYVLNSADKSLSIIEESGPKIHKIGLPAGVSEPLTIIGIPNAEKIFMIENRGSNAYRIYKEGDEFKIKTIGLDESILGTGAILGERDGEIYIIDQSKKAIKVFDPLQEAIKTTIELKSETPAYLLSGGEYIVSFNHERSITLIDTLTDNQIGNFDIKAEDGYSFNSISYLGLGAIDRTNKKIYLSSISPNRPAIAIFDSEKKQLIDILDNDNLKAGRERQYLAFLFLAVGILVGVAVALLIFSRRQRESLKSA